MVELGSGYEAERNVDNNDERRHGQQIADRHLRRWWRPAYFAGQLHSENSLLSCLFSAALAGRKANCGLVPFSPKVCVDAGGVLR